MFKKIKIILLAGGAVLSLQLMSSPAYAQMCFLFNHCSTSYVPGITGYCGQGGQSCCQCSTVQTALSEEMDYHRQGGGSKPSFLFDTYWYGTVFPGLEGFLSQISSRIVKETTARGTFFEAQNNAAAIRALQEGQAQAARNYFTSEQLCRFGTLSQSLAADDAAARSAQLQLATIGLKRNLGAQYSVAEAGRAADVMARMNEFISEQCDERQENSALGRMCSAAPQRRFEDRAKDQRYNRDVNYTRTVDINDTLEYNTSDSENLLPGEQDIVALGHNLYGSSQPSERASGKELTFRGGQETYLTTRAVVANRSVAQNTYAAIVAMKTRGSGATQKYMKAMYQLLGATPLDDILVEKPSYYAQMEVLTKKLYQDPAFYVNLMEGKTNVERQSGAMEGVELMQDRDIYLSMRRSEMLLATLIQLQTRKTLADTAEDIGR